MENDKPRRAPDKKLPTCHAYQARQRLGFLTPKVSVTPKVSFIPAQGNALGFIAPSYPCRLKACLIKIRCYLRAIGLSLLRGNLADG